MSKYHLDNNETEILEKRFIEAKKKKNNGNYGVFGWSDGFLFITDNVRRQSL